VTAFSSKLQDFVADAPFCVMTRGLLENVFAPGKLDDLFERHSLLQYHKHLLFSTAADLLAEVVLSIQTSLHTAYKAAKKHGRISVRAKSLYEKLAGTEPGVCRALLRHSALEVRSVVAHFTARPEPLLEGYDVRILDGNHLAGTHKRLKVLRGEGRAALPGLAVAVLDPRARLIDDVVFCPDGHAQECRLALGLLAEVQAGQLWITDRHFCTSDWLFGLKRKQAFFLARQHMAHLRWELVGQRRHCGRTDTGEVYQQPVKLTDPQSGEEMTVRRVTIELYEPTRDGDAVVHLLSNVPEQDADAPRLAELYLKRWLVETAFFELTVNLGCEVNALGYPQAALLCLCLAMCCYNLLAAVKAAIRQEKGAEAEQKLSGYYVADEVSKVYCGMDIATRDEDWEVFRQAKPVTMAGLLAELARRVDIGYYSKNPVRPKKQATPPGPCKGDKHVSTYRLLNPDLYPPKKKGKKGAGGASTETPLAQPPPDHDKATL
jgi:hypothetical protein